MPRNLLLTLLVLLLTASAWAGVVSGPEDIPGDPAVPPPQWKVEALERKNDPASANRQPGTTRPGSATAGSTTAGDSSTGASARGTSPTPMETPAVGAEEKDLPAVPGGQSTWPLIAIAVLLLLFAGGGGYYFYATRED